MGTKTRIKIAVGHVCFNRTEMVIDDSANMSYTFENDARRVITLRWIGTQEETMLPIWEFRVYWPNDDLVVMEQEIVGYGEFVHEGNTLLEVHTSQAMAA
ncbi:MAG: hypothetical protein WAV09_03940 [Minisyncoccia bacterium]